MKIEKRTVYICEYCGKRYFSKYWCNKHEEKEKIDMNTMCGKGCKYLTNKEVEVFDEDDFLEELIGRGRYLILYYCKKRKCFVYPPIVAHKGNAFTEHQLGEKNIPMPKECEFYVVKDHTDFE